MKNTCDLQYVGGGLNAFILKDVKGVKIFITIDADNKSQALLRIFDGKGSLVKQQQSVLFSEYRRKIANAQT